jgi:ABC-type Fe3+-hydroxamate transport system substrate-binding protein
MKEFMDQMSRKVSLHGLPKRIISLVPSQTELLYHLGLRDEVVGITRFCIHPTSWFQSKPRVGGTKKFDFEKIKQLNPDLVIGNKEENDRSQMEELMNDYPVWMSDVKNLEDALFMIHQLGEITGRNAVAGMIKNEIELKFRQLKTHLSKTDALSNSVPLPVSAAYLIWYQPLMAAGRDTFINDMLSRCGFKNCFDHLGRYAEINDADLLNANPGLILLSSEPFPFRKKHLATFRSQFPESNVMLVNGELFSWYGSRLLKSPDYFLQLVEQIKAGD